MTAMKKAAMDWQTLAAISKPIHRNCPQPPSIAPLHQGFLRIWRGKRR